LCAALGDAQQGKGNRGRSADARALADASFVALLEEFAQPCDDGGDSGDGNDGRYEQQAARKRRQDGGGGGGSREGSKAQRRKRGGGIVAIPPAAEGGDSGTESDDSDEEVPILGGVAPFVPDSAFWDRVKADARDKRVSLDQVLFNYDIAPATLKSYTASWNAWLGYLSDHGVADYKTVDIGELVVHADAYLRELTLANKHGPSACACASSISRLSSQSLYHNRPPSFSAGQMRGVLDTFSAAVGYYTCKCVWLAARSRGNTLQHPRAMRPTPFYTPTTLFHKHTPRLQRRRVPPQLFHDGEDQAAAQIHFAS
jgi:hypothetical protein